MIKLLIVDDSVLIRMSIEKTLRNISDIEIVGFCNNGSDVFDKVKELKPDVITLDIEMPKMNGLEVLEKLMETHPIPVIMVSSLTKDGSEESVKALELGAVDIFLKPDTHNLKKGFDELIEKIRIASKAKILNSLNGSKLRFIVNKEKHTTEIITKQNEQESREFNEENFEPELVAIGISTGGPASLNKIIPSLPEFIPFSIVIAQHMPPTFTKSLAIRLNNISKIKVKELEDSEQIEKGIVYIAPSGFQTRIKRKFGQNIFSVEEDNSREFLFKPCIDVLFSSASEVYKDKLLGIIMTGMGNDGTKGSKNIKNHGGKIFVQSEESCVIASMPKSVIKENLHDKIYDLNNLSSAIMRLFLKNE
ncbi:MAG: chemotaxis response regulator protein-glutamate methylesterase [Candidatus Sericytochromatia bacterium]